MAQTVKAKIVKAKIMKKHQKCQDARYSVPCLGMVGLYCISCKKFYCTWCAGDMLHVGHIMKGVVLEKANNR